jgi:glyoxylase I family protein
MGLLRQFDNIDILCTDLDSMATFYTEVLELPLLFPREPGDDWFAVQTDNVTLYFFPGKGGHPEPFVANSDDNPPGLECFSFVVEDLDAAVAWLDGRVPWLGPKEEWHHSSGTWYRFRYFHDPEGNKVSITEPHKARG